MDILITPQVREEILSATHHGVRIGLEFGGSLVAHEDAISTLIAYAIPTGPRADQSAGHIRTDADFQSHALGLVQQAYPALAYVGDWHVHPMRMPYLSGVDRRTAREILSDDQVGRSSLILLLGSLDDDGAPDVFAFVARPDGFGVDIQRAVVRQVEPDSPEVSARLGKPLAPLDSVLRGPTLEPERPARLSRRLARCVERDLGEIRLELGARTSLLLAEDLCAQIHRGAQQAVVLFPPEYPWGAPRVFAGNLEEGPLQPIPLRYGWSSRHRLTELVSEALDRTSALAPSPRTTLTRWSSAEIMDPLGWPDRFDRWLRTWLGRTSEPLARRVREGKEKRR